MPELALGRPLHISMRVLVHLSGQTLEWKTLCWGRQGAVHTLEQAGVNNSVRDGLRREPERVCFSGIGKREGVGGLAVQPHTTVLFRT